jgi:hypothetical protein
MERGEGGELTREKVRGAMLHKAGQKYRLSVSPAYKLYYTPVKTTFRAWCLYRYLVHAGTIQNRKNYSENCDSCIMMMCCRC